MELCPVITADFNNIDPLGRVRLNTIGSIESLAQSGIRLRDGVGLVLTDGELVADVVLEFSDEQIWVGRMRGGFRKGSDSPE